MNSKPLRVLHLTDTHILEDPEATLHGVDSFAALRLVLAMIRIDSWAPHVVIATGDLSQDSSAQSYRRLRSLLTPLEVPVYCIPGNHDDVSRMHAYLKGGPIFMERLVKLDVWDIVLLDSQMSGEEYGVLRDSELKALEEALGQASERPTLIALHHGPISICPLPQCQLENADAFLSILDQHAQVRGVISGHIHCEVDEHKQGVRMLVTPSTFLHVGHPNGLEAREACQLEHPHEFNPGRRGVRCIELYPGGQINTRVLWENRESIE